MHFHSLIPALLADLQLASGCRLVWKDADRAIDALLPETASRHSTRVCLATKAGAVGMARCRLADEHDEARWRASGWVGGWRTCHAGVCELVLPVRDGTVYLGTLFVAGSRARAEAAGRLAASAIVAAAPARGPARALALATTARSQAVVEAIALLERRPDARLRAAAVARSVGLSRSRFAHAFAEVVGEPFVRYRARRVAAEAARLLAATTLPVAGIAARLGYPSPEYLAQAFRRLHGRSPSAFRRSVGAHAP